jgi:hypothetical protein
LALRLSRCFSLISFPRRFRLAARCLHLPRRSRFAVLRRCRVFWWPVSRFPFAMTDLLRIITSLMAAMAPLYEIPS